MLKKILLSVFALQLTVCLTAQVVINEYSASNLNKFKDSFGKTEDWIELYNTSNSVVDLSGWHLSDKTTNVTKWSIPTGTIIPAKGFLVFLCSGRDIVLNGEYHTNFKLTQTKGGDVVVLADVSGMIQDQQELGLTMVEHSNSRVNDGSVEWMVSTEPTVGTSNNNAPKISGYTATPSMSLAAGFFTGPQTISIMNNEPNSVLRYTTDGGNPTIESPIYMMPLTIDKTQVVKAQAFSNDIAIHPGKMDFNTYLIDEDYSLAVFSVAANRVTNLANGFGKLLPIGSIEYFDKNKERTATSFGSLNRHGQDSWVLDHRSIDWISRDEMGYSKAVDAPLFSYSKRDEYQKFMFRNSGDDNYPAIEDEEHEGSTHIRDEYVQTLAQEGGMKLDVRAVERVILFLNGEYWGVYGMREKVVDHDFTEEYYNQGKYETQYLSTWEATDIEYGGTKALADWVRIRDFILNNDMSQPENYKIAKDSINLVSLIDYFTMNQATVASDWLNYNTGWWRGLNPDGDHKKWGYILWDLDATFDYYINYTGIPDISPTASLCDIYEISDAIDSFFDGGGFENVTCADFGEPNNSPYRDRDTVFQQIINYSPNCCTNWDSVCQGYYDNPSTIPREGGIENPEDCIAIGSPYPTSDSIFQVVVNTDFFCCGEWDELCQQLYNEISGGNIPNCPIILNSTSPYPAEDLVLQTVINFNDACCDEWGQACQSLYDEIKGEVGVDVSGCTIFTNGTSPYPSDDIKVAQVIGMNPDCCEKWGVSCQNDYDIIGPGQDANFIPDSVSNIPGNQGKHEKILLKLFKESPDFKQLYYSRYADLMNTVFDCENMHTLLNKMVGVIEPEMPKQIARWGGTIDEWQLNLDTLRQFIDARCAFLSQDAMACHGDLTGQFSLTLLSQPAGIGEIDLNTLTLKNLPWTGDYFGGMENKVKAKVAKNFENEYEFSHWESKLGNAISPSIMDRNVELTLTQTDTLVAIFKMISSVEQNELVINELMASNDATVADQDGEFDDWIELYNTTNQILDLTGYFLTDNAQNLDKYDIPEGTTIPSNGYLIIWADEDGMQEGLHANFKLSRSGESLFLVNADTVIIDEVTFDKQMTDITFARFPNGTGSFETRTPTFNSNNNDGTTGIDDIFNNHQLVIYPNPANFEIFVQLKNPTRHMMDIEVYDVFGRIVLSKSEKTDRTTLDVQDLSNGFYFVVVNKKIGQKVVISRE